MHEKGEMLIIICEMSEIMCGINTKFSNTLFCSTRN